MNASVVELVRVIWGDACHMRDPQDAKVLRMMSFGMKLKDDDEGITLAQSQSQYGSFMDCLFIPRAMIVDVVPISLPAGSGKL